MAPEVLLENPYNHKLDVWSMGAIIFELFSKRLLGADYMNTTQWDESEGHAQKVAGGWRPNFPLHMPESIRALISSCWAQSPARRPSMAQVVQQLQEIAKTGIAEEMDAKDAKSQGCACSIM